MKKKTFLFLTLALILVITYYKIHGFNYQLINQQQQKELRDYQQEQQRVAELQKLQNPKIIENQLYKVGKLTTLEGEVRYQDTIRQDGLWGYVTLREISLDFYYEFGMGIDLKYIKVKEITPDKTVILMIPKERIQLQYLELDQNKSRIINGKKFIFVNQFSPSDVETIIGQSQQAVANKIGTDNKYFDMAEDNLKVQLKSLIGKLGYKNVQLEEM